jgi:hypothetical protein
MPIYRNGILVTDATKIDSQATDGLLGASDSLAYRVHEIERHLHSYERWFETASVPNGEVHVADRLGDGGGSFQIDAGNDDWGAWLQILGSSDTPSVSGEEKYDLHRLEIDSAERNSKYYVQIAFGTSGAAAIASGDYTEGSVKPVSNQIDSGPVTLQARRQDAGTKAWARCKCPGQDTATLDFTFGIHEYEG